MYLLRKWIFPDAAGLAVCIYEISGGYGLLPRILYYVLFSALVFGHRYQLIQHVALLSVMLFSACSAIHAFILVGIHTNNEILAVDLDMLAILPILAIGAITVVPIMEWSRIVRRSESIFIIICWGLVNWTGAIVILVGLGVLGPKTGEAICRATDGTLLQNPYQLIYLSDKFNCTYTWFEKDSWVRTAIEARIFEPFVANGYPASLGKFDYTFIWLAGTILIQPFQIIYTGWLVLHGKTSLDEWTELFEACRQRPRSMKILLYLVGYGLILLLSFHNFVVFLATMVVAELYIHEGGYQANDSLVNVGEWSGWVYVALILTGSGLIAAHDKLTKQRNMIDDEEALLHPVSNEEDIVHPVRNEEVIVDIAVASSITTSKTEQIEMRNLGRGTSLP